MYSGSLLRCSPPARVLSVLVADAEPRKPPSARRRRHPYGPGPRSLAKRVLPQDRLYLP